MNDDANGLTATEEAEINRLAALLEKPTYKSKSQQSDPETHKKAKILLNRGFSVQVVADTVGIPFAEVWKLSRNNAAVTWSCMSTRTRADYIKELWDLRLHPIQIQKRCDGLSLVSLRFYLHNGGVTDTEMLACFPDVFADISQRPSVAKKNKLKKAYRAKQAKQSQQAQ